jgi:hypothetical protein
MLKNNCRIFSSNGPWKGTIRATRICERLLNMPLRIKTIAVRDAHGQIIKFYAPNHIGSTETQLLEKAKAEASTIQGKVTLTYSK